MSRPDLPPPGLPIQLDTSPRAITFLMSQSFGVGLMVRSRKNVSWISPGVVAALCPAPLLVRRDGDLPSIMSLILSGSLWLTMPAS